MLWIVLFAGSTAFVLYILFGYPVLLYFLANSFAKPVRREPSSKRVSILIAVHNGEAFVADKLASIFELSYPAGQIEIILACDGCTDATEAIAKRAGGNRVRVIGLPRGGKAVALNQAMEVATGEIFLFTDIRQKFDRDCVRYLLESFADPQVGVVSGRLCILKGSSQAEEDIGLYWRYEFWLRTQLSRLDSYFGATGACYALRRELAVPIPPGTLLDDMYEPLAAFFRGYRLIADERARIFDYPTTLDTEYHRKVRTLAGNYQIIAAYPGLLGSANRLWFHFVSYKFGRLLLPFALLIAAISSFGLPTPWRWIAVGMQFGACALALVDPYLPKGFVLKRLSSIVRTFLVLMIATVHSTGILFGRSPQNLWKQTDVAVPKT